VLKVILETIITILLLALSTRIYVNQVPYLKLQVHLQRTNLNACGRKRVLSKFKEFAGQGLHHAQLPSWETTTCRLDQIRPTLWSSGQSSWLQIQRSGFESRHHQIFWEVVGLERGPLSLLSTIEELFERKRGDSGLENRDYGHRECGRADSATTHIRKKLTLTSPTSDAAHTHANIHKRGHHFSRLIQGNSITGI
jgi:hypothetical protein